MAVAIRRIITRMDLGRVSMRMASTKPKRPPLAYKGRIPRPDQPPPGPGEAVTPGKAEETVQAQKADVKSYENAHDKDYQKRYNQKFWRWMAIICGTPIVLVTTPYLFQRVFLGQERKRLVIGEDDDDDDDDDDDEKVD